MGIAAFEPLWLVAAALVVVSASVGWALGRRDPCVRGPAARRRSVDELVRALCRLNAQVAADATLAALLVGYVEAPEALDRVGRVRARAWFDAARRLHRLLHEALDADPLEGASAAGWAPSMGEQAQGASGEVTNLTLIDPEFMAWVEAMRDVRGV